MKRPVNGSVYPGFLRSLPRRPSPPPPPPTYRIGLIRGFRAGVVVMTVLMVFCHAAPAVYLWAVGR